MAEPERPAIVLFAPVPWTEVWQRPHHFAAELARRGHRVLFVETLLRPGGVGWEQPADVRPPAGVTVVRLGSTAAPHIGPGLGARDVVALLRGVGMLVDENALRCPVLLVQHPWWQPLVAPLRETTDFPVVYDCIDLHNGWPGQPGALLDAAEEELARGADLVLASAPLLAERMRVWNWNVLTVPNACDPEHFAAGRHRSGRLRPPLDGPVIGYAGDLEGPALDVDLLVALSEARPDWTLVLVGPVAADRRERLDRLANVVLLGAVDYAELPALLGEMDVTIVPFLVNALTAAVDPIKVWEYLAAGKPVVCTPLPTVYPLQGLVEIADGPDEFIAACGRALVAPDRADERAAAVAECTWSRRVDGFHEELLATLPSLDIVVISYDNPEPLRRTLHSIARDRSHAARLIVVDNGSASAETRALLDAAEDAGATVLRNPRNAGYPAAVNQGVAAGTGRYVLLLNDDVQLPAGGTLAFVHALARSTRAGLCGPVTNRIGNEARIDVPYDRRDPAPELVDAMHEGRVRDWSGVRFELAVTALFAAIVRRRDYEAVGGLSEHYLLGQFEDDELAERIRHLGLRVLCCEDVFVHHAGSTSFGALDPLLGSATFHRNQRVFERETGGVMVPHRMRGDDHVPPAPGTV